MSLENLDDITDEELEGIDLDDPEAIDAFLEGREQPASKEEDTAGDPAPKQDEKGDASGQSEEGKQAQDEKPDADSQSQEDAKDSDKSEQDDEAERYVATADGKGKIPYEVLKGKREEVKTLKAEKLEMQEKLDAALATSKKASAELEKRGIDITALDQGETLTDAQLEELADIDPALAQMARTNMAMYKKVQEMEQSIPRQENVPPERQAALNDPDLASWIDGKDPDRWDFAVATEAKVSNDPKFKDASLSEVYAEVAKRTKAAFGDSLTKENPSRDTELTAAQKAAAKVAEAQEQGSVPVSLSNMGKSPDSEVSRLDQLAGKSDDELAEMVLNGQITDEELEQYALLL